MAKGQTGHLWTSATNARIRRDRSPRRLLRCEATGNVIWEDNMVLKQKVVLRDSRGHAQSVFSPGPIGISPGIGPTLTPQNSGTTNRLQAVSAVNSDVVWASGSVVRLL